jgi:hypothetical protein
MSKCMVKIIGELKSALQRIIGEQTQFKLSNQIIDESHQAISYVHQIYQKLHLLNQITNSQIIVFEIVN